MKKLIAILMVTLGVNALNAESWLWWMIDSDGDHSASWNTGWEYARIAAIKDGETTQYLNIYAGDNTVQSDGQGYVAANFGNGTTKDVYAAALGSYTLGNGWTYALEVYNSDHGWNGMSEGSLPSNIGDYVSIGDTAIPTEIFNFGSMAYTAVPEPNSAMLLLLGLSALALRRKQKKA